MSLVQTYFKRIEFIDPDGLVEWGKKLFCVPAFVIEHQEEGRDQLEQLCHQDRCGLKEHVSIPKKDITSGIIRK